MWKKHIASFLHQRSAGWHRNGIGSFCMETIACKGRPFSIFSSPGRSLEELMHSPMRQRRRPHLHGSFFKGLYFPNHFMELVHIW